MICEDWRDTPAAQVAPLFAAEHHRWTAQLGWDADAQWSIVEAARAAGALPGFVIRGPGGVEGWTFYCLVDGTLQIGALVGQRAACIRRLLDTVIEAPEAALARQVSCFLFPRSDAVRAALVRRRFELQEYLYLRRSLDGLPVEGPAPALVVRPYAEADGPGLVRLLADAYSGVPAARCFAPRGHLAEWARYLGQLLQTPACGVLMRCASYVGRLAGQEAPAGAVLTTAIGRRTAHLAQVAVDRRCRGLGIGRALVEEACRGAARAGHREVTLLVAADNTAARALYGRSGFESVATFLFGSRPMPTRRSHAVGDQEPSRVDDADRGYPLRLNSVAPEGAGATTRR